MRIIDQLLERFMKIAAALKKTEFVPGRLFTGPESACPFCRLDGEFTSRFKGTVLAETINGYIAQIGDNLLLACSDAHVTDYATRTDFDAEVPLLITTAVAKLGWVDYNVSINIGQVAGQRLEHLHHKVQRRVAGRKSSGWGLDALIKMIDGEMATSLWSRVMNALRIAFGRSA